MSADASASLAADASASPLIIRWEGFALISRRVPPAWLREVSAICGYGGHRAGRSGPVAGDRRSSRLHRLQTGPDSPTWDRPLLLSNSTRPQVTLPHPVRWAFERSAGTGYPAGTGGTGASGGGRGNQSKWLHLGRSVAESVAARHFLQQVCSFATSVCPFAASSRPHGDERRGARCPRRLGRAPSPEPRAPRPEPRALRPAAQQPRRHPSYMDQQVVGYERNGHVHGHEHGDGVGRLPLHVDVYVR